MPGAGGTRHAEEPVALFAMGGGERAACTARFGVSAEALKKHLRAILDATGAANLGELADA